jgi:hypothetical protein
MLNQPELRASSGKNYLPHPRTGQSTLIGASKAKKCRTEPGASEIDSEDLSENPAKKFAGLF